MKLLVYLGHPAHYYLFSKVIKELDNKGHSVCIACKRKDILEDVLKSHGVRYRKLQEPRSSGGKVGLALTILRKDLSLARYVQEVSPDLMVGTETSITHVGRIFRIPAFYFVEDDLSVIRWVGRVAFPFATKIVSPNVCHLGKWEYKKVGYDGYQKLAYLHPKWFFPDGRKVEDIIGGVDRYFLLRFSSLGAHHDNGIRGISVEIARELVKRLSRKGKVLISSERELGSEFDGCRLKIDVKDIHHLLAFAGMFISDSQSMSVEAAMLGTPSIRVSDFSGRISVLEELEKVYGLTYGIPASEPKRLFEMTDMLLARPDLVSEFRNRRDKMLADKVDVASFFVDLIENYGAVIEGKESFSQSRKES